MRKFGHIIYEGFYATDVSKLPKHFRNCFQRSVVTMVYCHRSKRNPYSSFRLVLILRLLFFASLGAYLFLKVDMGITRLGILLLFKYIV